MVKFLYKINLVFFLNLIPIILFFLIILSIDRNNIIFQDYLYLFILVVFFIILIQFIQYKTFILNINKLRDLHKITNFFNKASYLILMIGLVVFVLSLFQNDFENILKSTSFIIAYFILEASSSFHIGNEFIIYQNKVIKLQDIKQCLLSSEVKETLFFSGYELNLDLKDKSIKIIIPKESYNLVKNILNNQL